VDPGERHWTVHVCGSQVDSCTPVLGEPLRWQATIHASGPRRSKDLACERRKGILDEEVHRLRG